MFTYRGKRALVTGASSGIGKVFAHKLAERGMHLVLVARSEDKLHTLADELTTRYAIQADVIPADLSHEYVAHHIYDETQQRNLPIDMLVNNAGFATYGQFGAASLEQQHNQVMVNVNAVVDLTYLYLPAMVAQRSGAIINIASGLGFIPTPYMAVYAAAKAFVLSFSEALWAEYGRSGVRVLALCPGTTRTEFFDVAGMDMMTESLLATPEYVVDVGLRALERHRSHVIPGWQNTLLLSLPRLLPRTWVVRLLEYASRQQQQQQQRATSNPSTP